MFRFEWIWALAALPLPLLAILALPQASQASSAALRLPFFHELLSATAPAPIVLRRGRFAWAALAWVLLVLAAARPQWVGEAIAIPVSGRDLLMAVDISGSMKIGDLYIDDEPHTRLEVVKKLAGDFIERRNGDRIGLILFGTRAYLQTPLTFDRTTVGTLLDEAEIGLAGERTAIGDAIGLAVKRLRAHSDRDRVLILLTDGTNTAGEVGPLRAAELAKAAGLKIYTIGVGAEELVVQDFFGARRLNPSADLDEHTLTAIAERTGGGYFRAKDTEGLAEIYNLLDRLEPVEVDEELFRSIEELFVWPLALSLLFAGAIAMTPVLHTYTKRDRSPHQSERRTATS
ncbi:MAG: VWA domain-containing protein [Gammaproteobacteria bacterium]|nr:VWA domain-containing protein [Gammaproteobacteria bacterium]